MAVAAGVIIAATVLGGVATYLRSLELVAVGGTVDGLGAVRKNVQVVHRRIPFTSAAFEERSAKVSAARERHLSAFDTGEGHFIRSPRYHWGFAGSSQGIRRTSEDPQALFARMAAIDAHLRYTEGRAPSSGVRFESGVPVVEASLLARRARELDIQVGDVLDFEAVGESRGRVAALITGVFEPVDLNASYWNGLGEAVLAPAFDNEPPVLPLIVQDDVLWAVASATPGASAEVTWIIQTDAQVLRKMPPSDILSAYDRFRAEVEVQVPRSTVFSGLEPGVRELERRILFARIPMFLMGALLLAVVAYYMFMVAGLLADRRRADIAMLRSRGISALQIGRLYALEGAAIVAIAAIAGPVVARILISQLGRLPIYEPVTAGAALPTEVSWASFAWAAAVGVAALAILAVPAIMHARTDVAGARRASGRPASVLWFQRFYLDAVVLVMGGLVLWELRTRRTVVTGGLEGEQSADITMLFAPALLLVGVTIIFLRVYPPLLRLVAWASARRAPVWLAMPLWRLSRNPFQYAWPMLLLVLAAGLAVLAAALGSTLERSSRDRSAYETGADIRASSVRTSGFTAGSTMEAVRAVDGVRDASLALRETGNIGTTGRGQSFDVLAVEADRFGQISWFRDDFAGRPLPELLARLPAKIDPPPINVPDGATHLAMWTRAQPAVAKLFLWVVLRDESGRLQTVTFGPIEGETWRRQVAPLPETFRPPFSIVSVLTFEPVTGDAGTPASVFFDDLVALQGEDGEATVLVDFERRELWNALPTSQGFDATFDLASEVLEAAVGPHRGASVARVTLGRGTDSGVRGIYRSATASPIPIIASDGFLARSGYNVGDRIVGTLSGTLTPMLIVDSVTLFPTMDLDDGGFVIVDLETLTGYAELRGVLNPVARMFEVFVDTDPALHGRALEGVRAALGPGTQIVDRPGLESSFLIDPLTVAGWRGVGLVATVATLTVAALGLLTYLASYFSRTRVESGFLRALGLARSAQVGAVAIEQLSVTLIGLLLGTAAGVGMTRIAVDSVSHTESGRPVLPPFVLAMEWLPVVLVFGGLTLVAALALGRLAVEYVRLPLHVLTRRDE